MKIHHSAALKSINQRNFKCSAPPLEAVREGVKGLRNEFYQQISLHKSNSTHYIVVFLSACSHKSNIS